MPWIRKPRSTGWRDVSDLITGGWEGSLYVQRSGSIVMLRVHGLSAAGATGPEPFTLPAGLRPVATGSGVGERPLLHTTAAVLRRGWFASSGTLRLYGYQPSDVLYGDFRFDTADPWPTGLLGVST